MKRRNLSITPAETKVLLAAVSEALDPSPLARAAAAGIGFTPAERRLLDRLHVSLHRFTTADAIRAAARRSLSSSQVDR